MRTYILLTISFVFLLNIGMLNAQDSINQKDVPETIVEKLGNLFPGAENVLWTKLDKEYYASFLYEENSTRCEFTYTGRWLISESDQNIGDLPRSLQKCLSCDFKKCAISRIILKETKDISEYIICLNDTVEELKIIAYFDIAGNFVKKTDAGGNDLDISLNNTNTDASNDKKQVVHPKELPSSINSYIIVNYPEQSIKESYFINNEVYSNTYYIIIGQALSAETIELWFDFQGKLFKTTDLVENQTDTEDKNPRVNNKEKERVAYPENRVPAIAVTFFKKKEAKAEEIRWDTIGVEYVVSYYNPNRDYDCRMYFDKQGHWVKTAVIQDMKSLHPLIQRHIDDNYYDLDFYSAEYYAFADKSKYTLVKMYDKKWLNDPMVYNEMYYSRSGRLEKEVLADYIDPDDEYYQEQEEKDLEGFQEYLDEDDLSLQDGDMVDGQIITQKELPSKANTYISKTYTDYRFLEAMTLNEEGKFMYSVFLKREGYNDRKRVLFDLNGNFIKDEDI